MKMPDTLKKEMQRASDEGGPTRYLFPDGAFNFVITDEAEQEPRSGKEFGSLQVDFKAVDNGDGDVDGKKHREWFSLNPNASFRIAALYDACGLSFDEDSSELKDCEVILKMASEEQPVGKNKGKMRNVIDFDDGPGVIDPDNYEGELGAY